MELALKTTHLLTDDPATADEFGTHKKIAGLIREEVLNSSEGRSIALVGDWGSGKSTIIELLKRDFAAGDAKSSHLFIYDAWSHQGDSLRRAFLDDLIASLKDEMTETEAATATDQIWNRTETTTTTKEPVLRRHAKMLLVSLALIPLGMKLFEMPADTGLIDSLELGRNLLAYLFLLAPVLAVAIFGFINWTSWTPAKNFLFGDSHKEKGFSVLSFFFERVQGHVERKHIKTPVDSIQSFRDVFSQLIDNVYNNNKELRVIIIIDNIDRIPPEQARNFWSTMQTFFGDSGGLRKPQTKKYWLIAPFSVEALSFIFRDENSSGGPANGVQLDACAKAKAYIDKTFALTFYVPPPILTNWRRYLLSKLHAAFPEHSETELIAVRDAFDFARSGQTITPRDMKLFINGLVALYRQRGDDIALAVMALYVLHRGKIAGTALADDILSPREKRVVADADWRVPIAALHFGVTTDEATQLLLQEPIVASLREGSKEKLKALEPRPGFAAMLSRVAASELESPEADDGTVIAQMAGTIGGLDGASKPEVSGVWWDIRNRLRTATVWKDLQPTTADGVGATLTHTPSTEKAGLCEALAASLSKAQVGEPEGDFQKPHAGAGNWLRAARAVIEGADAGKAVKVGMPTGNKLKLELLQQLADIDATNDIKAAFRLDLSPAELSKTISEEISNGRFPRSQVSLVSLLKETMKIELQWKAVETACMERLRVTDVGANEVQALINLLLAGRTVAGQESALNTLKTLSTEGHLSRLLQVNRKNAAVRSYLISAIMLANPDFDRPAQIDPSPNGDANFNDLTGAATFDAAQIKGLADAIRHVFAGSLLFEIGAKHSKIGRLSAAVLGELTKEKYKFDIEAKTIIEQRNFVESNSDINPVRDFIGSLNKADAVLALLMDTAFEVGRAQLYRATLPIAVGKNSYVKFLEEGVLTLDKNDWEKALNADTGPHFELLQLASELRKLKGSFELSTPARDAALDQIRNAGQGKVAPSDENRARLALLLSLLPTSLRGLLIRDVVDDMVGQTEPAQIVRRIEMAGDHIDLQDETDPERIVRRIFAPVVGSPTERSVAWVAATVGRMLEQFAALPAETKSEFGWRLKAALQEKESLSPALVELVIKCSRTTENRSVFARR